MSGGTLTIPVDPTIDAPAELFHFAGTALPAVWLPPEPQPGDPDTPYVAPAPAKLGQRVVLAICHAGSHQKICEVETANVESWDDPLSIRTPSRIVASASVHDPCWTELGAPSISVDGRNRHAPDWRRYELLVTVDGVPVAVGFLDEPVSIDADRISLNASGPAAVLRGTMGDAGTGDWLFGAGSFATAGGDAETWLRAHGWQVPDAMECRWNSTDPLSSPLSLQVRGFGFLRGPVLPIEGDSHFRRQLRTTAIVRHSAGQVRTVTEVYADGTTQVNPGWSLRDRMESDPSDEDWQQIASTGTLDRTSSVQFIRIFFELIDTGTTWVDIDEVRYPPDTYTGSRTSVDLAAYPGRIMRKVQEQGSGDSQALGIRVHSAVPTGFHAQLSWATDSDVSVIEALGEAMDRPGGPEVWFDPGWQMWSGPRRGRNRDDLVLDESTVLVSAWETDPRAIVDQLRVLTRFGAAGARIGFAYDTPRPPGTRINRQIVPAPTDLRYEPSRLWGAYQAERASREQWYADLDVVDTYGALFGTGDGVRCILAAGNLGFASWVRVANRRFNRAARTCTLTVGLEPGVLPGVL